MTRPETRERRTYLRTLITFVFAFDLRTAVGMTARQEEVVREWLECGSYEEAGRRLGITGQAVMAHVQHVAKRAHRLAQVLHDLDEHFPKAA